MSRLDRKRKLYIGKSDGIKIHLDSTTGEFSSVLDNNSTLKSQNLQDLEFRIKNRSLCKLKKPFPILYKWLSKKYNLVHIMQVDKKNGSIIIKYSSGKLEFKHHYNGCADFILNSAHNKSVIKKLVGIAEEKTAIFRKEEAAQRSFKTLDLKILETK